jgi:hypothetical protein
VADDPATLGHAACSTRSDDRPAAGKCAVYYRGCIEGWCKCRPSILHLYVLSNRKANRVLLQHAHFLEFGVIRTFEFVSQLRRMSVIIKRLPQHEHGDLQRKRG